MSEAADRDEAQPENSHTALLQSAQDLVEHLEAIVWEAEADSLQCVFVNRYAERLLGYPLVAWLSSPSFLTDRLHPDDRPGVLAFYRTPRPLGVSGVLTYRMLAADGRSVWLRTTVYTATSPERSLRLHGVMVDISAPKRTEECLRLTKFLADHVDDSVFLIDAEARFRYVNASACQRLGYRAEELGRMGLADIDPRYPAQYLVQHWDDLKKRQPVQFETVHRTSAGIAIPVEVTLKHLVFEGQELYLALARDITKRKRAQEALRVSEESIRALYEATAASHLPFAEQIRTLLELGCRRFNLPSGAVGLIRGTELEIAYLWPEHASLKAGVRLPLAQSYCDSTVQQSEPLCIPHVATTAWRHHPAYTLLSVESYFGTTLRGQRGVYGTLCFMSPMPYERVFSDADRDFLQLMARWIGNQLEQQQAMQALQESEERFRQLTEHIPDVFWMTTADQRRLLYVSPAYTKIWGRTPESLYADPDSWQEAIHPEDRARLQEALRTPAPHDQEYRILRADGAIRWIHERAFPIRDDRGTIQRIAGLSSDVTERKRLEAQLRQAQRMEAIGTLAGGIAHDFNNILAAILGFTELTLAHAPAGSPVAANLQQVLRAGARARKLIQQILTFSRSREEEQGPVRLDTLLREVMTFLRASIPSTIEMSLQINMSRGMILGDATQLQQLILNLCSNAEYAMGNAGGRLDLILDPVTVDDALASHLPTLEPGEYLRLTVRDTGCGIPADIIERIFEPFFTTKPVGEGTGLGLATAHGIVAHHRGVMTVNSVVGQGTTFEVYLPRLPDQTSGEGESPTAPFEKGAGHILFVDDEDALVQLGTNLLSSLGYSVMATTSSTEALVWFQANPDAFDLVITDQTMPHMTGEALARAMLALRPDLPVILCTGFSRAMTEDQAKRLGIRAYLTKPISMRDLAKHVHHLLHLS